MRLPRVRFTMRRLVAIVAISAVALAILRIEQSGPFLLVLAGSMIGTVASRNAGKRGIVGGMVGGGSAAFVVAAAWTIQWGFDAAIFLAVVIFGAILGLAGGIIIWAIIALSEVERTPSRGPGARPRPRPTIRRFMMAVAIASRRDRD